MPIVIQKIKNSLKKRKVKVFLVFLLFSTLAWFINTLSESYVSNTTFDLKFSNVSDELLLVNSSQDQINAKLEAIGFQFLGFNFKKKEIIIDLSEVQKEGNRHYMLFQKYKVQIEKQLPSSMRVIDLENDTLFFDLQELISKEVPVKPLLKMNLEQNHLLDKITIIPATVTIKGPYNEVDTISSVTSVRIDLIDLNADFSRNVSLIVPQELKHTTISTSAVTIKGNVVRFSEKIINVKIKTANLPSGTTIKMFPDEVRVLCKGTISALKNLNVSDFEVIADFNTVVENGSKKIGLLLVSKPETLSKATLQDREVEYILKREQ